jgi:uncharacterized membrane protein YdjX (TVP38/TMEM64 family)
VVLRAAIGVLILLAAATGAVAVHVWPHKVAAAFDAATRLVTAHGQYGWIAAAALQIIVAMCGILPASMGALGAGMMFGTVRGFLLCGPATMAGAWLAFLLSRSLFRPFIIRAVSHHPRMGALDEAVGRDGWRLVLLLRISPIMPFAATSYALGLTSIGMGPYMQGTLASLPALLGYVVLGDLAGDSVTSFINGRTQPWHWVLLTVAIAATALLTLRLGRIIQQVMQLPESSLP